MPPTNRTIHDAGIGRHVTMVSIALALFAASAATVAMSMHRHSAVPASAAPIASPTAPRGLVCRPPSR